MDDDRTRLVYSDDPRRRPEPKAPGSGRAVVRLERKGRGGKAVTVLEHLALSDDDLKVLLKQLQRRCGTGGTVKEHHIELQGDFREQARTTLKDAGYRVA